MEAQGRPGNRGISISRKVRTPQGGITANGRPLGPAASAAGPGEEQGHRDESAAWAHIACAPVRPSPYGASCQQGATRQGETRQPLSGATSNRHAPVLRGLTGGPPKHAGRWLERVSNGAPRGMIARRTCPAYRIRPTGLSCLLFFCYRLRYVNKSKAYRLAVVEVIAQSTFTSFCNPLISLPFFWGCPRGFACKCLLSLKKTQFTA